MIFFILTSYLIFHKKLQLNTLLSAVVICGFFFSTFALAQTSTLLNSNQAFFTEIHQIKSSVANKNLLSSLLFLLFPFVFTAFISIPKWRTVSVLLLLSATCLIIITQTKAVWLAFFIYFLTLSTIYPFFLRESIKPSYLKIFLGCTIAIVIVLGWTVFHYKDSFSHVFNKNSASLRMQLWDNSADMFKDNYLLGVGPGNWQIHFPSYGLDKFQDTSIQNGITTYQRPHNDFLWVLCETGFLGFIAFASIFVASFWILFILIKRADSPQKKWFYGSLIACLSGYIIISFVDYPLERIEHQTFTFLIFSILTANHPTSGIRPSTETSQKLEKGLFLMILLPTLIFSIWVVLKRASGENYTRQLYAAHHRGDWALMLTEASKAKNRCYTLDPMSAPIDWYKGVALYSMGRISEAKTCFENSYEINPFHLHVLNNLGSCYESEGNHEKAKQFYLEAIRISPYFDEAILNLSAVYFNLKDFDTAFKTIDRCAVTSKDPKYVNFLPAILNAWIEGLIQKQKNPDYLRKLNEIRNSKSELTNLYFEAKKINCTFEKFLFEKNFRPLNKTRV